MEDRLYIICIKPDEWDGGVSQFLDGDIRANEKIKDIKGFEAKQSDGSTLLFLTVVVGM